MIIFTFPLQTYLYKWEFLFFIWFISFIFDYFYMQPAFDNSCSSSFLFFLCFLFSYQKSNFYAQNVSTVSSHKSLFTLKNILFVTVSNKWFGNFTWAEWKCCLLIIYLYLRKYDYKRFFSFFAFYIILLHCVGGICVCKREYVLKFRIGRTDYINTRNTNRNAFFHLFMNFLSVRFFSNTRYAY